MSVPDNLIAMSLGFMLPLHAALAASTAAQIAITQQRIAISSTISNPERPVVLLRQMVKTCTSMTDDLEP